METEASFAELDAAALRKLGLLGLVSGDEALAQTGKALLEDATERARSKGARFASMGSGFILDPATGKVSRDAGYAEYEKERDVLELEARRQLQADQLERLGHSADLRIRQPRYAVQETEGGIVPVQTNPNAAGGAGAGDVISVRRPVSDSARQQAAEAERLAQEARDLYVELSRVQGVVSSPKDISTELLGNVPGVGRGMARATQEGLYSDAQNAVKTRGARFEQNLSNLAAGLALTGYEIQQRDRWSPFATGISQEESRRRLVNVERDFGRRRDALLNANGLQPSTATPQGGSASDRVINGRRYRKQGGEWYEVPE